MTSSSTLYLRERQKHRCRLAPEEIAFLLDQHRTHFDLAPTPRRHVWDVTPAGVAGVVVTPRRRIVITPKIPLRNFLCLHDAEGAADLVSPENEPGVIDPLAERLAALMRARADAGLHRDYRDAAHEGPYLVGQLDVAAQLRQPVARKDQLHSRHDEFTVDLACNQVPRTLAAALARSPLVSDHVRAALTAALVGWGDVSEVALTAPVLAELRSPRLPGSYRALADLCLLLADAVVPSTDSGVTSAPAILVSMERWFEQYLTKTIVDAFADSPAKVHVQQTRVVGEPDVSVRPDVTLTCQAGPRVVVDAKWKRLAESGPESADLYQALSYALLLGAECAVLVYPGRKVNQELTFPHTPLRVLLRTLDVAGSRERCQRSRQRLGRELRRFMA